MSNCSFKWKQEDPENNLSNINLSIYSGELVMVIGSVGSGKSNLLASINGIFFCYFLILFNLLLFLSKQFIF